MRMGAQCHLVYSSKILQGHSPMFSLHDDYVKHVNKDNKQTICIWAYVFFNQCSVAAPVTPKVARMSEDICDERLVF